MEKKKTRKIKHFVLDTNVLLHDANALVNFEENFIYITIDVLEELDHFKRDMSEKGRNARHVIRKIDELRSQGLLHNGVKLNEDGGMLFIMLDFPQTLPPGMKKELVDNRIIMAAKYLKENKKEEVIFVTKDINARVKAEALDIHSEDYEHSKIDFDELYTGVQHIQVSQKQVDTFLTKKTMHVNEETHPNQFIFLDCEQEQYFGKCTQDDPHTAIPLQFENIFPWGIKPLNNEQRCALELLLDDSISLVSLVGLAGTGKTLLAIAAGLHKVTEERKYKKVLITRPVIPVGRDIGYLPGSKEEKLESWMEPIFDNLNYLLDNIDMGKKKLNYFLEADIIELEAMTYIRGRSIASEFIIIDEAQNLTPHEVKTIVSRVGKNSKIILTGDPYQIDNPYLDSSSNGLTYLVDRFKGQSLYGHMTMMKSERSVLASLAAELL